MIIDYLKKFCKAKRSDIDEKVVENAIIHNVKNFILTFGKDFSFICTNSAGFSIVWGFKMDRPVTTLFMLSSVDGKISTGASDERDVDKDFPKIDGIREGLHQYYEIEQTTDLWSFNTGRVQAKMGVNYKRFPEEKLPVSFVILDNHHLTEQGVRYLCVRLDQLVVITTNVEHPVFHVTEANLHIIYQDELDLEEALRRLKQDFGCKRLTIQSGGTVNSLFLREQLLDYIDIVVAPVLIGGKDTATLVDGISLVSEEDLKKLGVLQLEECKVLEDSWVRLRYKVVR